MWDCPKFCLHGRRVVRGRSDGTGNEIVTREEVGATKHYPSNLYQ